MTVSLKHLFQSSIPDDPDTSLVRPSDWNAEHTLTLDSGKLLGRSSAGTGAAEEITVGSGLSLSGGTLSNSQSTTLTVNSTPTSGGAAGQIMFDTGSVLQESSNLVWDNTNGGLRVSSIANPTIPSLTINGASNYTGSTLSGVQITGTGGQFSCNATTLTVGKFVTISGTIGGTGSITGYSNPTTYRISATNGTTTFTLVNATSGAAIVTTSGTPTGLTYTVTDPFISLSQTWNNSNVVFRGLRYNFVDTASQSSSLLVEFQNNGGTVFNIRKDGAISLFESAGSNPNTIGTTLSGGITFSRGGGTGSYIFPGDGRYAMISSGFIGWSPGSSPLNSDLFLTRRGAANLRFGAADAAAPVAQTLSVQSVVAGTSNTAGANLTITGSQGTGTGAGGNIIFQVAPAGSSGTAQNALVNALTLTPGTSANRFVVSVGNPTGFVNFQGFTASSLIVGTFNNALDPAFYSGNTIRLYNSSTVKHDLTAARYALASDLIFAWSSTTAANGTVDLTLRRRAAANLQLGAADAAAPVAQTLSVQSVVAGTTDTAGADLTITGSQGTGTGAAGNIIFQTSSAAASTGTAQNALATVATIGPNTLTGSQATSLLDLAQTWNTTGTPSAIKLNVTDTASAAASLLMDLQVGGSSRLSVAKSGNVILTNSATVGTPQRAFIFTDTQIAATNGWFGTKGNAASQFEVAQTMGFASNNVFVTTPDLFLGRRGAANLRLGAADAAAPVAQTLSVQSVVAGTSNTAGANLTITGSQGTGTGAGGSIIFQVAPAGSSGTAQNALATAWQITGAGHLLSGSDNTYDIGASNSLRPRNIFVRGIIYAGPSGLALSDASSSVLVYIQSNASGVSRLTNSSGNDFGRLCFGDYTSSFPALKRSTTILQVRLADDSAYAPVEASTVRTATAYTVATLPAAGTAGRRAYVTDATAPTWLGALTGGGAVVCPVFDNGTAWVAG